MQNRYLKAIPQLLEIIKPNVIAEVGSYDIDITDFYIDSALKYVDKLIYLGLCTGRNLKKMDSFLKNKSNYVKNFSYILINLDEEIDINRIFECRIGNELAKFNYKDVKFVFASGLDDSQDFASTGKLFSNADCYLFDRYVFATSYDFIKTGCNSIVDNNPHSLFPEEDSLYEDGNIYGVKLAILGRVLSNINPKFIVDPRKQEENVKDTQRGGNISIKTRNALPNEVIQMHVEKNIMMSRKYGFPVAVNCEIHNNVAYLVGGAPSYKEKIHMLKNLDKEKGEYLFVCKTSHDYILDKGIKPFGCILLDPREHVPGYVKNCKTDMIYFVASQCNPETVENLLANGNKIVLYHAAVNAGESEVIKRLKCKGSYIIGGSTSITRGIFLLNALGFWQFKLFGIDSSYPSKPEKVHGINQEKKAIEVAMTDSETKEPIGGKYWTDPELIAQLNDIEIILKNCLNMKIENYSEGMMKEVFEHVIKKRKSFKDFINSI